MRLKQYSADKTTASSFDAYLRKVEGVYKAIKELETEESFIPDIIVGHSGWGSLFYARVACPKARIVGWFEWYHRMLPEFRGAWFTGRSPEGVEALFTQRNAVLLSEIETCDVMITATKWQQSGFPAAYSSRIRVLHEGTDTEYFSPDRDDKRLTAEIVPEIGSDSEVISYVSRGLEPTRCFPLFMDAVRLILAERPKCHVVIAGKDRTFYGSPAEGGKSWKALELEKGGFDPERVHFTGWLSREDHRSLLRGSSVHVYMTLPFVLSWSMMEAMAAGCCVVGSVTAPVEEVIADGVNGLLVYNMTPEGVAERIKEALSDSGLREKLGADARKTILEKYCLKDCLQKQTRILFGED